MSVTTTVLGGRMRIKWWDTGDEILITRIDAVDPQPAGLAGVAEVIRFFAPSDRPKRCRMVLNRRVRATLRRHGWRPEGLDLVLDARSD